MNATSPLMSYGTGGNEPKANREAKAAKVSKFGSTAKARLLQPRRPNEGACHEASGIGVSLIGSRREQDGGNSGQ